MDYKAASSGTWINAATATPDTSVNLSGLTAGTLHDWRVRATCPAGTGSYVQAQFTTTGAGGACPGTYDVSTNGTTAGAATIPLNTDVNGLINPKGDNDYYKFIISTGGTITISLTTLPANYQLALLNSGGTVLQSSTNSGTTSETINSNCNGRYLLCKGLSGKQRGFQCQQLLHIKGTNRYSLKECWERCSIR